MVGGCGFDPLPVKGGFYRPTAEAISFNLPENKRFNQRS